MVKHYLNDLICACSDEEFGQDAVEYAIQMGHVKLTGDRESDLRAIMGQYDAIVVAYQSDLARNQAIQDSIFGPVSEEIAEWGISDDDYHDRQLFDGAA